jgi:hypothetical protein
MSQAITLQLYLQQPLQYSRLVELLFTSSAEAFDHLLQLFDTLPIGSDGCLVCDAVMNDDVCLVNYREGGYSLAQEDSTAVIEIIPGTYMFQQLQFPPTSGKQLLPQLSRFALSLDYSDKSTYTIYVRIYKEKQFETAIQFISPSQTKEV